jgi:hypothetical protein
MRKRMIFDLPREIQMAIRLQAIKSGRTTGQVVEEAVRQAFPEEWREAQQQVRK